MITESAAVGAPSGEGTIPPPKERFGVSTGIAPLDARTGGLEPGGSYLIVGAPGPAKMVAALHFVQAGVTAGEPSVLLTNADAEGVLGVASAWGLDLRDAWLDGRLRILGFRDDFELRALRTVEPEEIIEELDEMVGPTARRIAVDPGSLLLAGGARSLLGSSFLKWARAHGATVCTTFSVDGSSIALPSSADWLVHATTGLVLIEHRSGDLFQISLKHAVPGPEDVEQPVSVDLAAGAGLVAPEGLPARRGRDRPGVDERRLLLISLGGTHTSDIEAWARESFTTDVVAEPFEAVARAQGDAAYGGIVIHAPRARIREAIQACRALRPLSRAAIVFASDDAIRASDRVGILEAGADDCLSGGLDFRELDLRIRQAIEAGAKPVPTRDSTSGRDAAPRLVSDAPDGGRVTPERLRAELGRRADDPLRKFFCVLLVTSGAHEAEPIAKLVAQQVRADEGDLVSSEPGRCTVLLQGARAAQLDPFLERLDARLRENLADSAPTWDGEMTLLSHPADADRIRGLVETARAAEG